MSSGETIFLIIVAGIIGFLVQYFVIRAAVMSALRSVREDLSSSAVTAAPTSSEKRFFGEPDSK